MEAVFLAINQILELKFVQWGLLILCVALVIYTPIRVGYLKYDNALLKSTVGDVSQALYVQNRAVKELGEKAGELQTNYEQANKRATQVAVEGQKTLQGILNSKLVGSCDEKVKQVGGIVRKAVVE